LTGTVEGADKVVETGDDPSFEEEPEDLTAPEDFSSRTIASTSAFNLASSIK
jgi:hypothetical protein